MQIEVAAELAPSISFAKQRGASMPMEIAMMVSGIAAVFLIFAVTLAWADHYTHKNY